MDLKRIYPSIEELNEVYRSLRCTVCDTTYKNEPNLNAHLTKAHGIELLMEIAKARAYHCPITSCNYNEKAYFKSYKLLKQHFVKVHKEKTHKCFTCSEVFPNSFFRDRHYEYCNIKFKCCECEVYYYCYESLKTHGRRKKHKILEKIEYKVKTDQGSQTESKTVKQTQTNKKRNVRKSNQTIHTQTDSKNNIKLENENVKKSVDTQTGEVTSKNASSNTSFEINDIDFVVKIERSSSATQTNCPDFTVSYDTVHTDTSDLIEQLDKSLFNCMETQTDLMFREDDIFNCDDYSNMCTQTCENLLLSICEFNDIQTQTSFNDYLRSVESQTIMTNAALKEGCSRELSHMETQTDIEYKQMLEEIHA